MRAFRETNQRVIFYDSWLGREGGKVLYAPVGKEDGEAVVDAPALVAARALGAAAATSLFAWPAAGRPALAAPAGRGLR